jgi:hypothetical protein
MTTAVRDDDFGMTTYRDPNTAMEEIDMNSQKTIRILSAPGWPLCVALVLTLAGSTALARGSEAGRPESLEDVVRRAAEEILKLVRGCTVSVGQITPTALPNANGGPGIVTLLGGELARIRPGSRPQKGEKPAFEVKGDYNLAPHPDESEAARDQKCIRLCLRIIDTTTGEENSLRLTHFVCDNTTIARLTGVSCPLALDPSKEQTEQRRERNTAIWAACEKKNGQNPADGRNGQNSADGKNDQNFIDEKQPSLISNSPNCPYSIEVLAGPEGDGRTRPTQARPARIKDGMAFVDVKEQEVYEVRVYNRSPKDVAARVFVDSIDMFQFSDDRNPSDPSQPKFAYMIVPAAKDGVPGTFTIPGWHKSIQGRDNFRAFLVTKYGKGAASSQGIQATGPIGVIQVVFSGCYPVLDGIRKRSAGNETGFGAPRELEHTAVELEIEPPTDIISVRYARPLGNDLAAPTSTERDADN